MPERGIVVSTPFDFDGTTLQLKGGFDGADLRQWVLYWDKIDWPKNNWIHVGPGGPEIDLLEQEGVLVRSDIRIVGSGNIGWGMVIAQGEAFRRHQQEAPGAWSMAQTGAKLVLPGQATQEAFFAELELLNALPVPSADVPLERVLEFKLRRTAELQALRAALDEAYLSIIGSSDPARAALTAREKIESGVTALDAVLSESHVSRFLSSIRVTLDLSQATHGLLAGAALGSVSGFPMAIGAAGGLVLSSLKLSVTAAPRLSGLTGAVLDYAYLGHARRELQAVHRDVS